MARLINSFAQFIADNKSLRDLYDDAKTNQRKSIEETLRMIDLRKSQEEQNIVKSETQKQINSLQQEWYGVRNEPESQTNSKIGNTWEYTPEETKPEVKNKINLNITNL
jgi:hypothetical protein